MPRHEYRDSPDADRRGSGRPSFGWPPSEALADPGPAGHPSGEYAASGRPDPAFGMTAYPSAAPPVAGRSVAAGVFPAESPFPLNGSAEGSAAKSPAREGIRAVTAASFAGPRMRRLAAAVLVLAVLAPFGLVASLFWSDSSTSLDFVVAERKGVAYLNPLVRLVSAAADQQSLDVAGAPGDGSALLAAIRDVDAVDATLGDELGSRDRWVAVRKRLMALVEKPPTAAVAYQSFGQVLDLLTAMIGAVGDRSNLVLDPDLASYYLVDATLLRLPSVIVASGRLADLAGGGVGAPGPVGIGVQADQVRQAANLLDTAMNKSFSAVRAGGQTSSLVSALDLFGDAVTTMAPPSPIPGGMPDTSSRLAADRARVRDSALRLESAGFAQLDTMLADRVDQLSADRRNVVGAVAAGLLAVVLTLVLLGVGRRQGGVVGATAAGSAGSAVQGAPVVPGAAVTGRRSRR